jgi:Probable sensor domain DACNV
MSKFLYPRDLYRSLHKVWNASPFTTGWPPVALPEQQTLNQLLDVCYHASFLVEESRPVTFRAVFLEHTTQIKPLEADQSHPTELYLFDAPVPFTAEELRQVAPAADLTSVLIAIQGTDAGSGALGIVGLVDIGSSLWAMSRHERPMGHGLPDALIIAVTKPGQLTISRGSRPVIRLLDGGLAVPAGNVCLRGPVGDFFGEAAAWFVDQACALASQTSHADVQNDDLMLAYTTFVELLLFSATDVGHGGTVLFVSDALSHADPHLRNRVTIKYPTPSRRPQEVLLHKMAMRLQWQAHYGALYEQRAISHSALQGLDTLDDAQQDAVDAVRDLAKFLAGLTAVDGAVILTDRLRLLGFGAEVLTAAKKIESVRSARSEFADEYTEVPLSAFGTRHRSAFRFCSSVEPSVAFILSQDGGVKAVRQVGRHLVMWPYFEMGHGAGF